MYYRVKDNFLLRGWKLLPFALYDSDSHKTHFFDKKTFLVILKCGGERDFEVQKLPPEDQNRLEGLLKRGIVEKMYRPRKLNKKQEYKFFPSRYIAQAQWSITGRCNYKCKHCFMSAPEAKFGELCLDEIKKIVNGLKKCGIYNVSLTGGEPLVRNDFFEIVDELSKADINILSIYTNGRLITADLLEKISSRGLRPKIHMSYDGKDFHDWIRGVAGAQEAVVNAFKICQKMGFETTAQMCIHKKNKDAFCETMLELAKLGCKRLKVSPAVSVGNWSKISSEYALSTKQVYDCYLEYIRQFFENKMPISLMLDGCFLCEKKSVRYSIPYTKHSNRVDYLQRSICGHARNSLYISPKGYVLPCVVLSNTTFKNKFAKIPNTKLEEILNDSYYMKVIDYRLKDYFEHNSECANCEHRLACGGGCRGLAVANGGLDYFSKDLAACFFFKNLYHEKVKSVAETAIKKLNI